MFRELSTIQKLTKLLKPYPWAIPTITALGVLSSFFEGLGISLFIPLLQSLGQTESDTADQGIWITFFTHTFLGVSTENYFQFVTLCILGSIFLKVLISYINSVLFSWLNSRISHQLRSDIFWQILSVSCSYLEKNDSGQLVNTLATETWQTSRALNILINLIISLCTIVVLGVLLLLISWQMTLFVTIGLGFISLLIQTITRRVKEIGHLAVKANKRLATLMWEGFGGMRVIRSFGREAYEQHRYDQASRAVQNTFFKLDLLSNSVHPLSEILSATLIVVVLWIALSGKQITVPALLTFLFILHRLQPKVKKLDSARVGLLSLNSSIDDVMALLNRADKPYIRSGNTLFNGLQHGISFESVTYSYEGDVANKPALQDVSVCIPKGKTIALVGPSGAGKSTLVNLICRFYEPTEGEVFADGHPLHQFQLNSWRDRIAVVSQDIYIFGTTIRENIAYGRLDASNDDIVAASRLANAHEFITALPDGYETKVGDRGVRLSGGQRQRIALARAIIRGPEILILDEATNALDSISENLIQEALNTLRNNRTIIVIAHRLSTIEQADQIVVLRDGRVIEQGNLEQLLQLDGLFAELYRLQNRTVQVESCETTI